MRKPLFLVIAIAALILLVTPVSEDASAQPPDFSRAIAAQERHTPALLNVPGVVGTGVGLNSQGVPVIRVYVHTPRVAAPPALENIPVERVVTGQIVAQCYQDECPRPVPLGVSTGHPDVTAGTIGARVVDGSGNVYALSNNHVYANSNNASIGDSALQPGPYDGGSDPADKIGELAAFKPIDFSGGDNEIDAAIVSTTTSMVSNVTLDGYKPTATPVDGTVGLLVKKDGRSTGLTTGQISEINVTVTVCYEPRGPFMCARSARFVNQLAVGGGSFSAGGDSGSLIVTQSNNDPVGLLFAGSSTRTIANRIQPVLSHFEIAIDDSDDGDAPPPANPPEADFTYSCIELSCSFDASASTGGDGAIVSYSWTFGDGNTDSGIEVDHAYGAGGTYSVMLTVTDDEGASDSTTKAVTVASSDTAELDLSVEGYKVRGIQHVDLAWSGAASTHIDVFRDGVKIATTENDGAYTDNLQRRGSGSYSYRVCEANTDTCSAQVTVTF